MILCLCWIQFWQPRRNFWDKWPMKFGWMSKNGLVFFTEKNISFPWTGRLLFWRSLLKLFDDGPLFFSSLSENEEKMIFFFLICFPQVVPMDKWNASLTIVTKISCMKAGKCSLIVRNRYEILFSWKQKIFPDMFLGTRRMQFRQQLKKFRQQAGKVCSTSKNDRRNTISLEVFLHNFSYGQVEWEHSDKSDENS